MSTLAHSSLYDLSLQDTLPSGNQRCCGFSLSQDSIAAFFNVLLVIHHTFSSTYSVPVTVLGAGDMETDALRGPSQWGNTGIWVISIECVTLTICHGPKFDQHAEGREAGSTETAGG
jgi:hypothetical protein